MHRIVRPIALAALLAAAAAPLTGCSALSDTLHKQVQGSADSAQQLALRWSTPASAPSWVPADATGIRWIAATTGGSDAAPATVRVTTASALPSTCATIERRSLDSFGPDWAPTTFPDRVERCGNWAVMPVRGGWFGWTPLAPGERTAQAIR